MFISQPTLPSSGGSPATPSGAVQICGFGSSSTSFAAVPGFGSDSFGAISVAPNVRSSGSPFTLTIIRPADLTLASGVEASGVIYTPASVQFTAGAQVLLRSIQIGADTITATGSTVVTTASTVDIAGPPFANTNVTITNPYALRVVSGNVIFGGSLILPAGAANNPSICFGGTSTGNGTGFFLSSVSRIGVGLPNGSDAFGFGNAAVALGGFYAFTARSDGVLAWTPSNSASDSRQDSWLYRTTGGGVGVSATTRSSGSQQTFTIVPAPDTSITAGANSPNVLVQGASRQWATGAIALTCSDSFGADTLAAVGASTITSAYGAVFNAPVAGTNMTINNAAAAGFAGQAAVITAGAGFSVKTGSNCKMGTGALTGGTVTITNSSVTATSVIFLQDTSSSVTNVGVLTVSARTMGSFTVTSTLALDTSTFNYIIYEPS